MVSVAVSRQWFDFFAEARAKVNGAHYFDDMKWLLVTFTLSNIGPYKTVKLF